MPCGLPYPPPLLCAGTIVFRAAQQKVLLLTNWQENWEQVVRRTRSRQQLLSDHRIRLYVHPNNSPERVQCWVSIVVWIVWNGSTATEWGCFPGGGRK